MLSARYFLDQMNTMTIKLYSHQEIALSYLRMNDFFALYMDAGTGKTFPTLFRILDLLKSEKIEDALIVAPKSALGAWDRDSEKFNPSDRQILKQAITLINYESVWRKDKDSPYYKKWGCIVLDEAHAIKNRTSKQSSFLLKIACMSDFRYILTGTPISNGKLEDIWSQLCFLDPYMNKGHVYSRIFQERINGGSYYNFTDRYCIMNQYHKPSSYVRVNELQDTINEYSYRVRKSECLDLPEKLPDEVIHVELKEKAMYKKLCMTSALLEYEILAENPLSRMIKLRQLSSGHIKNENELIEVNCEKISILKEIIERYEADKKLVIFAEFKYSISKITELLKKMKIKHIILDGDQKDKKIWRKFQSDESIKIIIVQYKSGNAGIDLYASDTIIYYEPTIKSDYLSQSRDRIHRPGQKNVCSYVHLITKGTIETEIYRALVNYQDFDEKLFTTYMSQYKKSFSK